MNAAAPPNVPRLRRRRLWPWLLGGLPALGLLLVCGAFWWSGSETSLSRALALAQRWLPQDQRLEFSDAQGSLGSGGRIGRLKWSRPGLSVTIEDLRLEWSLRGLLDRDLRVRTLYARNVHVRKTPSPPPPDEPFTMPQQIALPVTVTAPLAITRLQFERVDELGTTSLEQFHDIAAGYRYNGTWHALRLQSLRHGESTAQARLQLHAHQLNLSAHFEAALRNPTPATPLAMHVALDADGILAGGDAAQLRVRFDAREARGTSASEATAAKILGSATLHPWRTQPVQQLSLEITALNAQAFHARAPLTALQGSATVVPVSGRSEVAWDAQLDLTNVEPGAWDAGHLPVRRLRGTAILAAQAVQLQTLRAELGGGQPAGTVTLDGRVPLRQPLQSTLRLGVQGLNAQVLMRSLPRTTVDGTITLAPASPNAWQMRADIRNAAPGPLDRERAPVERLLADVNGTADHIHLASLSAQVGSGRLLLQGDYSFPDQALDMRGELQRLPLRHIHRRMASSADALLSGKFSAHGKMQQSLAFSADMRSNAAASGSAVARSPWEIRSVQTAGTWSPRRLRMDRVHLDAFQARIDGTRIDISLPGLDSIAAQVAATAPGMELTADATMRQQSGGGKIALRLASAEQLVAWLKDLPLIGERLPAWRADGAAQLEADWQGGWRQWVAAFTRPASQPRLRLNALGRTEGLRIEIPSVDAPPRKIDIRRLQLDVQGNLAAATVAVDADVRTNDSIAVIDVRLRSTQARGAGGAVRWSIALEEFAATAALKEGEDPWSLAFSDGLQVVLQTGPIRELALTAGSATLSAPAKVATDAQPLRLSWEPMLWRRSARGATTVQSKGTVTGIQPAWLDVLLKKNDEGPLTAAGMRTDLALSGEWDVQMTDRVAVRALVKRDSGDLWFTEGDSSAGINQFDFEVRSTEEDVDLAVNWNSERAGIVTARLGTRVARQDAGWRLPDDAPLSGRIEARVRDLTNWTFLAPPGWRLRGGLTADIDLGGTVQLPRIDGRIEGSGLNLRSVLDGIELHEGTLRASLEGTRMQIEELTFQGGTGSRAHVRGFSGNLTPAPRARGRMTASGSIDWSGVGTRGAGMIMDLKAELERMQVVVRNDRQLMLSGDLSAGLRQGQLTVRGDLRVDRAAIVLPESSAPTVGDDVVIIRNEDLKNPSAAEARQRGQLVARKPIDLNMNLDLGRDLALEGQGITTRLEGQLNVRSSTRHGEPVSLFGEVRTVEGRYRAWGQALDVETGVVRFNGSMGNPSLDLLAIRPEIQVRAGVRVSGTLLAPRVQLYSDPDLPEGEKLSWVVLGRATLITGGEGTNLQQSALSLAAGQLAGGLGRDLGLDELGVDEGAVSIGKRITNELYLTYEAGLSGAASTLFIFYDITRRLTLRGETGEASAVDLIYTIKYD